MIIYPAIDLKDGNAVRLVQGRMEDETIFSTAPHEVAKKWEDSGFKYIHVVDLNGAVDGKPRNIYSVSKIIKSVKVPIQLGGGVRDIKTAEAWIEAGVSRVIVGTIAVKKPKLVEEMCEKFPGKIALGLDAKDGMVVTDGWIKKSHTPAIELAKRFEGFGVCAIIYTDISHDGLMEGPNFEGTVKIAESTKIPVICSGGISNVDDIKKFKETGKVAGCVIGRALYDGEINPAEALAV
jgi:phosphoribosylformimino-5-aminoimidazole carboxamide ribotide isomerase